MLTVAALYVQTSGCYADTPGVDPWDEARDARAYAGPYPVVAHPPCERWGRYSEGGPSHHGRFRTGDDGGCFAAAFGAVRRWGGVLEHPAQSKAWPAFGLLAPFAAGWSVAGDGCGWVCEVQQGHYGHRAAKRTWLYACRAELPSLRWGEAQMMLAGQSCSTRGRGSRSPRDAIERMCRRERAATPPDFRDVLITMARSARPATAFAE